MKAESQTINSNYHGILFNKLRQRGGPKCRVRSLAYWCAHQTVRVKWGKSVSALFRVGNGFRHGGILSPALFNLYMDAVESL